MRAFAWMVLSVVVCLLLLAGIVQIPAVQNRLVQKAITFLEDRIKTDVRLDHISLSFPKKIVLSGLYLEDQKKDTLLYAGELSVDTDLWGLARHRIQLNQVALRDVTGFVKRPATDSVYNFDYILRAFADSTTVEDTTARPWAFVLGNVIVENTRVSFDDRWQGNVMNADVGALEIDVDEFDLAKALIHIDDITLERVRASLRVLPPSKGAAQQEQQEPAPADTSGFAYDLQVVDITIDDVRASYQNQLSGQALDVSVSEAIVEVDAMDLRRQTIHLDEFSLVKSAIVFQQRQGTAPPAVVEDGAVTETTKPWTVRCDGVLLAENTLQYDDHTRPRRIHSVDFNHLGIKALSLEASDVHVNGDTFRGDLEAMELQEQSGFVVESMETDFVLTDKNLRAEDFHFVTSNSNVELQLRAAFDSLAAFAQPQTQLSVAINPSTLSVKDVLYFAPSLLDSLPLHIAPETILQVNAAVEGTLGNLAMEYLNIETLSHTVLQAGGTIRGLPDVDNAVMDISLRQFHTVLPDIRSILPDTMLPSSLQLPAWVHLSGDFKGTPRKPAIRTILTSDLGAVHAQAKLDMGSARRKPSYSGSVEIKEFNTGALLKQPETMGKLSMKAAVAGAGFTMDDLDTRVRAVVSRFTYQQYTYRDFSLEGTMKKYFFSGTAGLDDKNLNFKLSADLDYNENVPRYRLTLQLLNADLQALKLAQRPLRLRATLDVDLLTSDFTVINGNVALRKVAVFNGDALYAVDSMLVASVDQVGQSEITIRSDIVSGDFKGTINLLSLPEVVKRHVNQYFATRDTVYTKPAAEQNFQFDLVLKNTDLLTEVLLPDLEPFVPGKISGEFNSLEDRLNLHFAVTRFQYAAVRMDSVLFEVNSDPRSLKYALRLRDILVDTLRMEALRVDGTVAQDSIRTRMTILDSLQEEKYVLGGVFHSFEKVFRFRFLPGQVVLKYKPWEAPADNYLDFSKHGLVPHHFEITNGEEKVAVVRKHARDSVISVLFNRFDLENITSMVEGTTPVAGVMDGDLNLGVASQGAFNSNLNVHELTVFKQMWGDLGLQLGRTATGPYNIDVRLEGEKTEIKAAGYYTDKIAEPEINFKTEIVKLDLSILEPLMMKQLEKMTGQLTGAVTVAGKAAAPQIDGALTFTEASFVATALKSSFLLKDETITVKRSGLSFRDFKMRDAAGHVAELNGDIRTTTFQEFDLDLRLYTKDFQVLNSTEDDNDLFYGKVNITTTARIAGSSNQPRIDMNVGVTDESEFTYIVPQSDKGVIDQKGIVVFIDKDAKKDPFLAAINQRDTVKSTFRGIDLSANIELTDKETFNIVIDPVTGDKLSVKGNSTLTLTIDPTGDMQLSGRYEVSEGSYALSFYKLVKRNFTIEKGGTITWAGDPLGAVMDLRAVYEVETSPMELVSNQLTSTTPQEMNMYKQRLPFLVYLNIRGELLTPEIGFQLDMPESKRNAFGGSVYARIQDINTRESDLNKQVFALLVLKRFISDNPFESQGSDVAATARRSVSKLLTEQLNRLSENVKGLELSFDVKSYEDYSTGEAQGQTELQLGVSKSLFSDRLVVKVSGNLDLEGETSQQSSFTDYIGDLALEYKLTEDGRFRITGFRNSNYDMIDGDLIETGAGLIYIKDYNTLRELFRANEKEK